MKKLTRRLAAPALAREPPMAWLYSLPDFSMLSTFTFTPLLETAHR